MKLANKGEGIFKKTSKRKRKLLNSTIKDE